MTVRGLLALMALAATTTGCVGVVPYTPRTDVIEQKGYEGAVTDFKALMTRARAPRIGDADIDAKHFEIILTGNYAGGWGWGWGAYARDGKAAFYFTNIGRLDVYENNKVFVMGPDDRRLVEFAFNDQPDAFSFCDFIWSFRNYKGPTPGNGGGGGGGEDRKSSNVMGGDDKGKKSGDGSGGEEDRKSSNVLEPR